MICVAVPGTGITLNVQTSGNIHYRPGDELSLELDLEKLFLFDSVSGDN